jgi:hypothetical protein
VVDEGVFFFVFLFGYQKLGLLLVSYIVICSEDPWYEMHTLAPACGLNTKSHCS